MGEKLEEDQVDTRMDGRGNFFKFGFIIVFLRGPEGNINQAVKYMI